MILVFPDPGAATKTTMAGSRVAATRSELSSRLATSAFREAPTNIANSRPHPDSPTLLAYRGEESEIDDARNFVNSASKGIDFFISYTNADSPWAEWIAWTLRDGGYAVSFQPWDFVPGTNFPLKMQEAAAHSKRTIAVLSPAYLEANFTGSEWAAAFVRDPKGIHRRLIPVMVETCEPDGLLASIVSIRLMGLNEAD